MHWHLLQERALAKWQVKHLKALTAINEVTATPVLRPLIAMDKLKSSNCPSKSGHMIFQFDHMKIVVQSLPQAIQKQNRKSKKLSTYESFFDFQPLIEEAVNKREIIEVWRQQVK